MFEFKFIVSLIEAMGILALISLVYGVIVRMNLGSNIKSVLIGLLFSSAALLAMFTPVEFAPGIIFDGRAIMVALGAAFGGLPAAVIVAIFAGAARLYIGGAGALSGTVGILLSALLGYLWMRAYARSTRPKFVKLATGGAFISLEFLAIFILPHDIAIGLFLNLYPIIITSFILITVILGLLIEREHQIIEFTDQLNTAANTDHLTGLLNRRGFEEHLETLSKKDDLSSLIVLDLDHFKAVNDDYGHDGGDRALVSIAETIKTYTRPQDIVVRLGGEEFAIYMPKVDSKAATISADRILDHIRSTKIVSGTHKFSVTASAGIADYCPKLTEFWQAIRNADQALYRAKREGRDRAMSTLT
ncbi:GGDEF domain-containing protein [Maritalea sp. S77]|jgi:diguanylate cyclase|uniref:GGDEF domain-containing protein n=1 Tax=Maritalea sp. S77 TaxID=3415125 RepID=UPI003C7D93CC